jgi:hypothetical protein
MLFNYKLKTEVLQMIINITEQELNVILSGLRQLEKEAQSLDMSMVPEFDELYYKLQDLNSTGT